METPETKIQKEVDANICKINFELLEKVVKFAKENKIQKRINCGPVSVELDAAVSK